LTKFENILKYNNNKGGKVDDLPKGYLPVIIGSKKEEELKKQKQNKKTRGGKNERKEKGLSFKRSAEKFDKRDKCRNGFKKESENKQTFGRRK
jgi:hypothetical protein